MGINEKVVECFYGKYKKSILGKSYATKLFIYSTYVEGTGFLSYDNELNGEPISFYITFDEIRTISCVNVKGDSGIKIEYISKKSVVGSATYSQVIIMGLSNSEEILMILERTSKAFTNDIKTKEVMKRQLEEAQVARLAKEQEDAEKFYKECYSFHITNGSTPVFELFKERFQSALIYIDKDRNINFLRIDGNSQEETNGVIPFMKIHYFEKVGNIHYTSEIKGSYLNFGGSITSGTFSKKAALCAGLLLGPMGMVGGALFSHKPINVEMPSTSFNISSEVKKIDDRNVLLNYFSELHKQYIDIELPAEIYNFLQTYIPEKKYNIVMELEKKSAIHQAKDQIESGTFLKPPVEEDRKIEIDDNAKIKDNDLNNFKQKLEKLRLMKESGVLSEEEFNAEKMKLLDLI